MEQSVTPVDRENTLRPLLSPTQVAELFGCSLANVYYMCHSGVLTFIRIGPTGEGVGRLAFDPRDVEAFIAARKTKAKRKLRNNSRYFTTT